MDKGPLVNPSRPIAGDRGSAPVLVYSRMAGFASGWAGLLNKAAVNGVFTGVDRRRGHFPHPDLRGACQRLRIPTPDGIATLDGVRVHPECRSDSFRNEHSTSPE